METGWSLPYAKKCKSFPILRHLNPFQNILTAQCFTNRQGVTGGTDQTSGECTLGHTIPI